jgi:hypothetical protein
LWDFFLLSVLAAPALESRRGWRDLFLLGCVCCVG